MTDQRWVGHGAGDGAMRGVGEHAPTDCAAREVGVDGGQIVARDGAGDECGQRFIVDAAGRRLLFVRFGPNSFGARLA